MPPIARTTQIETIMTVEGCQIAEIMACSIFRPNIIVIDGISADLPVFPFYEPVDDKVALTFPRFCLTATNLPFDVFSRRTETHSLLV